MKPSAIALALTWDGARIPTKVLPPKARAFLTGKAPTSKALAKLFTDDQVQELRICWVPRLKGGSDVLSGPFPAPANRRISFKVVKMSYFDDICAMTYRRRLS